MKSIIRKQWCVILACCLLAAMFPAAAMAQEAEAEAEPGGRIFAQEDLFTKRDLRQMADTAGAESLTVEDGTDLHISQDGVYVLSGTASQVTVYVEAAEEDKVQLVLDDLHITNTNVPCIYVLEADKVFVTTKSDSSLEVTEAYKLDSNKADSVIFSKTDLILNGTAALTVSSPVHGVTGKDDLKITSGTYEITSAAKAVQANDSIRIAGGTINITAGTDGLYAYNKNDDSLGYVFIGGGEINIQAEDDAIHGTCVVQIDGGTITAKADEGIEGTTIQINGGTLSVTAVNNGINAGNKSAACTPKIEINDGTVTIVTETDKGDGLDSNGDIIINGGQVELTGASPIACKGNGILNGGTLTINGETVDTIS